MAELSTSTQYNLPPQYIQDYLGGGGAGVPGLFPLLNQSMYNQFATMGQPGATPYTYGGERIAGFAPRELEAFGMADQAIGSYLPYMQRAESLYGQGVGAARTGAAAEAGLAQQGLDVGLGGTREGIARLRALQPRMQRQLGTARGALGTAGMLGAGTAGAFDPTTASSYYNPYEEDVVQQTLRDVREGLAKGDMAVRDQAVRGGAFGGSRGRLQQEDLARQVGRGATEAIGGIRQAGYGKALGDAQSAFENQQRRQAGAAGLFGNIAGGLGSLAGQEAGLGQNIGTGVAGLGMQGAGLLGGTGAQLGGLYGRLAGQYQGFGGNYGQLGGMLPAMQRSDIGLLGGVGGAQRGMSQAINDLGYQNFVGQYNLPQNLLAQYSGIGQGIAGLGGGTSTSTSAVPGIDYMSSGLGGFFNALGQQAGGYT